MLSPVVGFSRQPCAGHLQGLGAAHLTLALGVACGGLAADPDPRGEGSAPSGGSVGLPGAPFSAPPRAARQNGDPGDDPPEATFFEEGCAQAPERVASLDCDPFEPNIGCGSGQACRPFVEYPESPCEPERFGARCDWAGSGTQGDPCNSLPCAAGFLCIATGQGTKCAAICDLSGGDGCPAGLICGSIDIEGIGACF